MNDFIKKVTSRKFILSLLGTIGALAVAFQSTSKPNVRIVAVIVAAAVSIVYGLVEGTIDKKAVTDTATETLREYEAYIDNIKENER